MDCKQLRRKLVADHTRIEVPDILASKGCAVCPMLTKCNYFR